MNKVNTFLVIATIVLSFSLGLCIKAKAQEGKSFMGVIPFMTSNSRLGFFDQRNGRIYLYDDNFTRCLFVGQVQDLGQSIQTLSLQQTSTNL